MVERSLPLDEFRAAESHLADCSACAANLDRIQQDLLLEFGAEIDGSVRDRPPEMVDATTLPQPSNRNPDDDWSADEVRECIGRIKDYELAQVIGRGGFGIVFEARDTMLQRKVAIKLLARDLANDARSRRRFIREARACAAINHQNIVTIHAVEESGEVPFIVMELIKGESLRDRIHRSPKLDFMDVLRISTQITQGLAAAHAQGIIHRDVKPGNIMLVDGHRVKIADFGLARVAIENVNLTSRGMVVGTPAYMSPEQVRGVELDQRSDLFSLGCVMYAMFAGHSPFHGRTMLDIAHRIDTTVPPPLAGTNPDVPQFLSDIISKLLEKDPEKRYRTAAEVAEILNQHLAILNQTPTDNLPSVLRRSVAVPPPQRRLGRWGRVAALVVMTGLAIGAGWFVLRDGDTAANPLMGSAGGSSESTAAALPVPPEQRKAMVTVAQSGEADFRTIREALQFLARDGELKILDDGEYTESLRLENAERYSGIRIVAEKRPTIRSTTPGPIVVIKAVPNVRLQGLKFQAWQSQTAVEIHGVSPRTALVDLEIERVPNPDGSSTSNAAVSLRYGAAGEVMAPITVRHVTIRSSNVGLVIGGASAEDPPVRNVVVEECLVHGLDRNQSTLLALLRRSEDVQIQRNIFSNGLMGLSVLTDEGLFPVRCRITRNTWMSVQNWVNWTGPVPMTASIQCSGNLIVDSRQYRSPALEDLVAASDGQSFAGNLAANQEGAVSADFAPLAATADAPIVFSSLSPDQANYLQPDWARLKAAGFGPIPIPGRYSPP